MARFAQVAPVLVVTVAAGLIRDARGQLRWDGVSPGPRVGGSMVYDSARGVAMIFGGAVNSQVYDGETWESVDGQWIQRRIPGPSGRAGPGLSYDSHRGVAVLFGGGPSGVYLGDTWEYNGVTWTQRQVPGPPPRRYPSVAFDSRRRVTVLIGGDGQFTTDRSTWEWDGTAWSQRATTGPFPRVGAAAYDPIRGVTVLYGGQFQPETWEWDGTVWVQRQVPGPGDRWGHSMVYDPNRRVVVLSGGSTSSGGGTLLNDTWEWDGAAWTRYPSGGPTPVVQHQAAYDPARQAIVLVGGRVAAYPGGYSDQILERRGTTWSEVAAHPPAGASVAMAYDQGRDVMVLFAGTNMDGCRGETWEFAAGAWTQRESGTETPTGRTRHAMAYNSDRGVTLLSGGLDCQSPFARSDLWEWDGRTWTRRSVSGLPPRAKHCMAYDTARHVLVVFGGQSGGLYYSDTWEWNGSGWTQRASTGPSRRAGAMMAYDPERHVTVLFGGESPASTPLEVGDTWEWNGATWTQRAYGPPRSAWGSMVYDPDRHRIVLSVAVSLTQPWSPTQTWEWDGSAWNLRLGAGAPWRFSPAAAYDMARHRVVLFGGDDAMTLTGNASWFLREACDPVFSSHPQQQIVPAGGHAVFSAAVAGAQSVRWRKDGVPLEDGPRISGAATQTLTIDPVEPGDAGFYCLAATSECSTLVSGAASLRLDCYPNCDGSTTPPTINISDFICFINRYSQEDPWANCDGSTTTPVLNVADFTCFLSAFAAGCP